MAERTFNSRVSDVKKRDDRADFRHFVWVTGMEIIMVDNYGGGASPAAARTGQSQMMMVIMRRRRRVVKKKKSLLLPKHNW